MFKSRKRQLSKLPKLTKDQYRAIEKHYTDDDVIHDTVEVVTVITDILLGAMIEPDRDPERWTRARIREKLASNTLRRYRTIEILVNAQHKESAFGWLRHYWNKFQLTKAEDGRHLHGTTLVYVDYTAEVVANI